MCWSLSKQLVFFFHFWSLQISQIAWSFAKWLIEAFQTARSLSCAIKDRRRCRAETQDPSGSNCSFQCCLANLLEYSYSVDTTLDHNCYSCDSIYFWWFKVYTKRAVAGWNHRGTRVELILVCSFWSPVT